MHPGLRHVLLNRAQGGNDQHTKLLLHFTGPNAAVATIDSSPSGHAVTFVGSAQLNTAEFKFGGSSLFFDGTDDYVSVPDHADWAFGTGDFTIDFWLKRASVSGAQENTFGQGNSGLTGGYHFGAILADNTFRFSMNDETLVAVSTATVADTNWHHVAAVRNGPNLAVAIDGNWGSSTNVGTTTYTDSPGVFAIGQLGEFTAGSSFNGWIDEFRISKGVARWWPGTNFIPPARPYS